MKPVKRNAWIDKRREELFQKNSELSLQQAGNLAYWQWREKQEGISFYRPLNKAKENP